MKSQLFQLLEAVKLNVEKSLNAYAVRTLKWSTTLKHPDIEVYEQGSMSFRKENTKNTNEVIVLSESPLTESCSWKVRLPNI